MDYAGQSPLSSLLVKVASRCNIDCSYCYWFRDQTVYSKPKIMQPHVLGQLLRRIEDHIVQFTLPSFSLILHGGEPLLWGIPRFQKLAEDCRSMGVRTSCNISLSVTTNGMLIDDRWLDCIEENDISVTVSIDGPAHIHDLHRHTFQGGPTHASVDRALRLFEERDIPVGILAVCNPSYEPDEFVDYFLELGLDGFDILFPDATLNDRPISVASFYRRLFDLWLGANREQVGLRIRTIESMVLGLLGGQSTVQGFGYGPIELCTVLTDGSMEALDVLRIAGDGSTQTNMNIFTNALQDIKTEPHWMATLNASLNLSPKCKQCKFMHACGGGYLPHRFSPDNGYDNPSAYCDDLYAIFTHIQENLSRQVYVESSKGSRIKIGDAMDAHAGPLRD